MLGKEASLTQVKDIYLNANDEILDT